jgi:hypothetical protein
MWSRIVAIVCPCPCFPKKENVLLEEVVVEEPCAELREIVVVF